MEKKLYELEISETLEHVMPPLQDVELMLLEQSLLTDGCRDPLVVWHGMIVDGHNRYRICREHGIPFEYIQMEFENESAAKLWIIRNQLARRNVPDFVRCEMVLPFEAELKAEAKKRQGQRNDLKNIDSDLNQCQKPKRAHEQIATMAGVSVGTLHMAKKLASGADEETKDRLRNGEVSIHRAYKAMKDKEQERIAEQTEPVEEVNTSATSTPEVCADNHPKSEPVCVPNNEPALPATPDEQNTPAPTHSSPLKLREDWDKQAERNPYEIMPGIDVKRALGSLAEIKYERPPDSVYDQEPVEIYGLMPVDNPETRSAAELAYACSELRKGGDYYLQSVRESLQKLSAFSRNEESLGALRQLVDEYYGQIMELLVL